MEKSALNTLLKMDSPKIADRANNIIKDQMIDCFLVSVAICQSCQQPAALTQPIICRTKEDVKTAGNALHEALVKQKGILCSNPKLIINYTPSFIHADLLK